MEKLTFETVAKIYVTEFKEDPPVLSTLDINDKEYLNTLLEAVDKGEKLTLNDLADLFMLDDSAVY